MNEENLKRLKSWMSENKHSQQEIADRMGVSQAYVNQLLNGLFDLFHYRGLYGLIHIRLRSSLTGEGSEKERRTVKMRP